MRILFCTYPTASDLFSTVPFAWALRAAGHEVLYAGGSEAMREITKAGLPYVDIAPEGIDLTLPFRRRAEKAGETGQLVWYRGDVLQESEVRDAVSLFAELSEMVVSGAVRLARQWRPDVVVCTDIQGLGPLVASVLSVPLIPLAHLFAYVPDMVGRVREAMAASYAEQDIDTSPSTTRVIRTTPRSMNPVTGEHALMRPVPYNGSYLDFGSLPDWLLRPPSKDRVCVTLGTVIPKYIGLGSVRDFVDELSEVDAEFVFVLGNADREELGTLPDNVHAYGWIPLNAVLDSCSAIIHHGGTGTTLAAMSAGVRQIVLPHGSDQPFNANLCVKRGLGMVCESPGPTAKLVRAALDSEAMAAAAREVRAEIEGMPAPSSMASSLEELIA